MKTKMFNLALRMMLILTGIALGCNGKPSEEKTNSEEFSLIVKTSLRKSGMDSTLLEEMAGKIVSQEYPNIHSVLIAKNGLLCYEKYFAGQDQLFGRDLGVVDHDRETLHDLRSVSKSIVSTCIGIAIDQGHIESVDLKISTFFPEYSDFFRGQKEEWTISHFLTMTTGLAWNEEIPYNDPRNDEIQMTFANDPIEYIISKELTETPGTTFNYNGGATQVLSEVIQRAVNLPITEFIDMYLFRPLRIDTFEWSTITSVNETLDSSMVAAASGLRLTSRDLLKIGLLYRNMGRLGKAQILSEEWVRESFTPWIEFPSAVSQGSDRYGYQFWMWPDKFQDKEIEIVAAIGNGDQRIYWDHDHDLIVVVTAGNYNQWDIKKDSYALLMDYIYPAMVL